MNELLWISVPGGVGADGRPAVRVLVVPLLEGATLGAAGMGSWPPSALLTNPSLRILWRADASEVIQATDVAEADVHFDATSGLWERFFGADLPLDARTNRIADDAPPIVEPTSLHAKTIDETFGTPAGVAFARRPRPRRRPDTPRASTRASRRGQAPRRRTPRGRRRCCHATTRRPHRLPGSTGPSHSCASTRRCCASSG